MSQSVSSRDKQDTREMHSVAKWCGAVPRSLEYDLWDQNSILDLQLLAK